MDRYREGKQKRAIQQAMGERGVLPVYLEFADGSQHFTLTAGKENRVIHEGETMSGEEFVVILELLGFTPEVLYGPSGYGRRMTAAFIPDEVPR